MYVMYVEFKECEVLLQSITPSLFLSNKGISYLNAPCLSMWPVVTSHVSAMNHENTNSEHQETGKYISFK